MSNRGIGGQTLRMSHEFGLRTWARDRTLPMLLGVAAFALVFMHSWLTLALAAVLAVVGLWLTIRANRRRGAATQPRRGR